MWLLILIDLTNDYAMWLLVCDVLQWSIRRRHATTHTLTAQGMQIM